MPDTNLMPVMRSQGADLSQPAEVVAIAKKADKRLNERYWHLSLKKNTKIAATAVAREMCGFIWAIMRHRDSANLSEFTNQKAV